MAGSKGCTNAYLNWLPWTNKWIDSRIDWGMDIFELIVAGFVGITIISLFYFINGVASYLASDLPVFHCLLIGSVTPTDGERESMAALAVLYDSVGHHVPQDEWEATLSCSTRHGITSATLNHKIMVSFLQCNIKVCYHRLNEAGEFHIHPSRLSTGRFL